jgi:hypothetical protein
MVSFCDFDEENGASTQYPNGMTPTRARHILQYRKTHTYGGYVYNDDEARQAEKVLKKRG